MYELDEETGKPAFTHNPFSMPQGGLEALETKDPLDILAYQYDIVCNGVELSSGAVRNHDLDIMVKAFAIAGYTEDDLKAKFSALYNAFRYGAPPARGHGAGHRPDGDAADRGGEHPRGHRLPDECKRAGSAAGGARPGFGTAAA